MFIYNKKIHYVNFFPDGNSIISLKDILIFCTGCDNVRPLGFATTPSIDFIEDGKYPLANTCANKLSLPTRYNNFVDLKNNFEFAFANSPGFGKP